MKTLQKLLTLALLLLIAACSYDYLADQVIPKAETQFARDYLQKLQGRDFGYVRQQMDQNLSGHVTGQQLQEVAGYFPAGQFIDATLIGSQVNVTNDQWSGNFTFEYHFSDGWALANILVLRSNAPLVGIDAHNLSIAGFHVYRTKASQKELNKFTLADKSPLQYLVLLMAVAAPLFVLISLFFCIRTPMRKRKWLWLLFIVIGFGAISIDWTTGQYAIQPLIINLLSGSAIAARPYAPWVITANLPLGALVFWWKRKALIQAYSMPRG
jgi:hypothetical protein